VFIKHLLTRDAQLLHGGSSLTRIHGIGRELSSWKLRISICWVLIWKRVKKLVENNLLHLGNDMLISLNYLAILYIYYLFYVQEKVDQKVSFLQIEVENMQTIIEYFRNCYSVQGHYRLIQTKKLK